jgi:adenylyltransferase/sulfurtransferase
VEAARDRLREVNPHVRVATQALALDAANAPALARAHDVVVDATDTFAARYAASDACAAAGVPLVHGSVARWEGAATVLVAAGAPCYRCLYPDPPAPGELPSCAEAGVLGVLPGLVGMVQATETLKLLAGVGETLAGRLLLVDARAMRFRTIAVRRDELCRACAPAQIAAAPPAVDDAGAAPRARAPRRPEESMTVSPDAAFAADPIYEMPAAELRARLDGTAPPLLVDVREPWEHQIAALPGARLVPLQSLPAAISAFDPAREYVVYCHHGVRSRMAAEFLRTHGVPRVANLGGGIDAWSGEVDPSVPRY